MSKANKAKTKDKSEKASAENTKTVREDLQTSADLKGFLLNVRDKLEDESSAAIFAMSALNRVLNSSKIYALLDNENKEIARDIWLRLKRAGLQMRNPPILFGNNEDGAAG